MIGKRTRNKGKSLGHGVITKEKKGFRYEGTDREEVLLHLVLSIRICFLQPSLWPERIGIFSVNGSVGVSDPRVNANLCLSNSVNAISHSHPTVRNLMTYTLRKESAC